MTKPSENIPEACMEEAAALRRKISDNDPYWCEFDVGARPEDCADFDRVYAARLHELREEIRALNEAGAPAALERARRYPEVKAERDRLQEENGQIESAMDNLARKLTEAEQENDRLRADLEDQSTSVLEKALGGVVEHVKSLRAEIARRDEELKAWYCRWTQVPAMNGDKKAIEECYPMPITLAPPSAGEEGPMVRRPVTNERLDWLVGEILLQLRVPARSKAERKNQKATLRALLVRWASDEGGA